MPRQTNRMPTIDLSWLPGLLQQADASKTAFDPTTNQFTGGADAKRRNAELLSSLYKEEQGLKTANKYTADLDKTRQAAALAEEQRKLASVGKTAIDLVPILAERLGVPSSQLYAELGTNYEEAGRRDQYLYGQNLNQGALEGKSGALSSTYKNRNNALAEQGAMPYTKDLATTQAALQLQNIKNPAYQQSFFRGQQAQAEAPVFNNYNKMGMTIGQGQTGIQPPYMGLGGYSMQGGTPGYSSETPGRLLYKSKDGMMTKYEDPTRQYTPGTTGSITPIIPAEEIEKIVAPLSQQYRPGGFQLLPENIKRQILMQRSGY